ncbi:MFS transporter [Paenibacillus thiaminolyticus]|uniref:MFS transporter n=1 Tax=Paenibacillus thiaminolyticus TaxID=49283 RepID=UPI003D2BCCB2
MVAAALPEHVLLDRFTSKGQSTVFFLECREALVPTVNGLNVLLMAGIALMPMLAKRIGKRKTALLGMAVAAFSQLAMYGAALASSIPLLVGAVVAGNIGLGLTTGLMYAMLADTVDYGEWRSGVRAQGLLTASSSFGVKFGMGIGGALAA